MIIKQQILSEKNEEEYLLIEYSEELKHRDLKRSVRISKERENNKNKNNMSLNNSKKKGSRNNSEKKVKDDLNISNKNNSLNTNIKKFYEENVSQFEKKLNEEKKTKHINDMNKLNKNEFLIDTDKNGQSEASKLQIYKNASFEKQQKIIVEEKKVNPFRISCKAKLKAASELKSSFLFFNPNVFFADGSHKKLFQESRKASLEYKSNKISKVKTKYDFLNTTKQNKPAVVKNSSSFYSFIKQKEKINEKFSRYFFKRRYEANSRAELKIFYINNKSNAKSEKNSKKNVFVSENLKVNLVNEIFYNPSQVNSIPNLNSKSQNERTSENPAKECSVVEPQVK